MTPAEFNVLVDSKIKHERQMLGFYDTMNALNCLITLRNPEAKLENFKIIPDEEIIEPKPMSDDQSVNAFKQWVTATGGKTI